MKKDSSAKKGIVAMIPNMEEEIKRHTEEVRRGKVGPKDRRCPYCKGEPEFFSLHEKRERQFLVFVVEVIKKVVSLLMRWKCPLCKRKFTEYPEFALPYKRYVKETVMGLSGRYVLDEGRGGKSYEEAVKVGRLRIGYVDEKGEPQDPRIEPTTVWKWVGFLGKGKWLEEMLCVIKEKEPQTGIFREIRPVPGYKYRSEERRIILERCKKFLQARVEITRLFG
jgi:hypothetical protein